MPTNRRIDVFKHIEMKGKDECWPWHGAVGGRAGEQRPYFQAEGKRQLAYRTVHELHHGVKLTPDQKLLHSCDNGAMPVGCCNPAHLRIGTVQDNSDDMMARERHGVNHHVVSAIRQLAAKGRTHQVIADLYGMSRENVTAIVNRRTHTLLERGGRSATQAEDDAS